jgi:hypothetical protein
VGASRRAFCHPVKISDIEPIGGIVSKAGFGNIHFDPWMLFDVL